ncbi:replication-relaxation family protein [Streptomyces sp. NPDC002387]|uniref:replication-relaxation family protein n=1 Tax=Streptomyces sp. NPDC002387 TaxID=3364643 RepID=UPI0036A0D585
MGVLSVGGGRLGADQGEGSGRCAVVLRSGSGRTAQLRRRSAQELGRTEGAGALGGSKTYPYGSTSTVRSHVLAALGVLKVATADQIRRLTCPGHKDNKAVRNACLDLAKHGLTLSEGNARDGQKLWGLTPHGLDAAAEALARPASGMGGTARGAGRSGAPHAMAVNETIIAITRTPPEPTRPVRRSRAATFEAADAMTVSPTDVELRAGIGTVASWSTEVAHNLPSTSRNRSAVQTDAVLHAPEAGVPVLLVEVDNFTESAEVLAGKFDRYLRFFRLKAKDHQGHDAPLWRTLYPPSGREGHPPVAVVFNPGARLGEVALKNRMNRVMESTRNIWSGSYHRMGGYSQDEDGYYDYADSIPVLFTTLERLHTYGPLDAAWWRCGHGQWQTLEAALTNPSDIHAWHQRDDELRRRREEQWGKETREALSLAWGHRSAEGMDAPRPDRWGTQEPHVANFPEPSP